MIDKRSYRSKASIQILKRKSTVPERFEPLRLIQSTPMIKKQTTLQQLKSQTLNDYADFINCLSGNAKNQDTQEIDWELTPELVLKFPNPDHECHDTSTTWEHEVFFDFIKNALRLDFQQFEDHLLYRAIQDAYCCLAPALTSLEQREKLLSSDFDPINSKIGSTNQNFLSLTNRHSNRNLPTQFTTSPDDTINRQIQKFKQIMEGINNSKKFKEIMARKITGKLKKMQNVALRKFSSGFYYFPNKKKWQRSHLLTADIMTLIRNAILLRLCRKGLKVVNVFSQDGKFIHALVYLLPENTELVANELQLCRKIYYEAVELLSLEPVDSKLRPLRLNPHLWRPFEYKNLSDNFLYLRPQIIELIKRIDYKHLQKRYQTLSVDTQLVDYGKIDINDSELVDDETWSAYYSYLFYLHSALNELHEQNVRLEPQAVEMLKQKLSPLEYYKRQHREVRSIQDLSEESLELPENESHFQKVIQIKNKIEDILRSLNIYDNSKSDIVSVLKLRFIFQLSQIMIDSLAITNNGYRRPILKNLWDRISLKPQPVYLKQFIRKASKRSVQSSKLMWARYETDKCRKIEKYSTQEKIKFAIFQLNKTIDVESCISAGIIHEYFPLHDIESQGYSHPSSYQEDLSCYIEKVSNVANAWTVFFFQKKSQKYAALSQYFGQQYALKQLYVEHIQQYSFYFSLTGILMSIVESTINDSTNVYQSALSLIIATFFIQQCFSYSESWHQLQKQFCFEHGANEEEKLKIKSNRFKGVSKRSPINDNLNFIEVSLKDFYLRLILTTFLTTFSIGIYSGLIVGLYFLSAHIHDIFQVDEPFYFQFISLDSAVPSFLNITLLASAYPYISKFSRDLALFENHSLIEEIESSIAIKIYSIYFFVFLFPIVILIFFSDGLQLYCRNDSCFRYVRCHFCISFLSILFLQVLASAEQSLKVKKQSRTRNQLYYPLCQKVEVNSQKSSVDYFKKCEQLFFNVLQFQITTISGIHFPFSSVLYLIFNYFSQHYEKANCCYLSKRQIPVNDFRINPWDRVVYFISYFSLFVNAGYLTIILSQRIDLEPAFILIITILGNILLQLGFQELCSPVTWDQLSKRRRFLITRIQEYYHLKQKQKLSSLKVGSRYPISKLYGVKQYFRSGKEETLSSIDDNQSNELFQMLTKSYIKSYCRKRVSIASYVKERKLNFKKLRAILEGHLTSSYKDLWTDTRLSLRNIYFQRKSIAIQWIVNRKYVILMKALKGTQEGLQRMAREKFAKQLSKVEDQQQIKTLEVKMERFKTKRLAEMRRKIAVVKLRGVIFGQFRKIATKTSSSKRSRVLMAKYRQFAHGLDNNRDGFFAQLINNERVLGQDFKWFYSQLKQIQPNSYQIPYLFPSNVQLLLFNFLSHSKKSAWFQSLEQFKVTNIFNGQITKLYEILEQYLEEELNPPIQHMLLQAVSEKCWIASICGEFRLLQFLQVRHGQVLAILDTSNIKGQLNLRDGEFFCRQANLVDQIDDFYIKGYAIFTYRIGHKITSLASVIHTRKAYNDHYSEKEVLRFLFKNITLLEQTEKINMGLENYFYDENDLFLIHDVQPEYDPRKQLCQIALEMITFRKVELSNLRSELNESQGSQLMGILMAIYNGKSSFVEIKGLIFHLFDRENELDFKEIIYFTQEPSVNDANRKLHHELKKYLKLLNYYFRLRMSNEFDRCYQQLRDQLYQCCIFHCRIQEQNDLEAQILSIIESTFYDLILSQEQSDDLILIIQLYFLKTVQNFESCHFRTSATDWMQLLTELSLKVKHIEDHLYGVVEETPSEQILKIIQDFKQNQEALVEFHKLKIFIKRILNQLNVLEVIRQFYNGKNTLCLIKIDRVIVKQRSLCKKQVITKFPKRKEVSLIIQQEEQKNFNQGSPTNIGEELKEFNIQKALEQSQGFTHQLLFYQYLKLLILLQLGEDEFRPKFSGFLYQIHTPTYFYFLNQLSVFQTQININLDYIRKEQQCVIGKFIALNLKLLEKQAQQKSVTVKKLEDTKLNFRLIMLVSNIKKSFKNIERLHRITIMTPIHPIIYLRAYHFILNLQNVSVISYDIQPHQQRNLQEQHELLSFDSNSIIFHSTFNKLREQIIHSKLFAYQNSQYTTLETKLFTQQLYLQNHGFLDLTQTLQLNRLINHFDIYQPQSVSMDLWLCYVLYFSPRGDMKIVQKICNMVEPFLAYIQPSKFIIQLIQLLIDMGEQQFATIVLEMTRSFTQVSVKAHSEAHNGFQSDLKLLALQLNIGDTESLKLLESQGSLFSTKYGYSNLSDYSLQLFAQCELYRCFFSRNDDGLKSLLDSLVEGDQNDCNVPQILIQMLQRLSQLIDQWPPNSDAYNISADWTVADVISGDLTIRMELAQRNYEELAPVSIQHLRRVCSLYYHKSNQQSKLLQVALQLAEVQNEQISKYFYEISEYDHLLYHIIDEKFLIETVINHLQIELNFRLNCDKLIISVAEMILISQEASQLGRLYCLLGQCVLLANPEELRKVSASNKPKIMSSIKAHLESGKNTSLFGRRDLRFNALKVSSQFLENLFSNLIEKKESSSKLWSITCAQKSNQFLDQINEKPLLGFKLDNLLAIFQNYIEQEMSQLCFQISEQIQLMVQELQIDILRNYYQLLYLLMRFDFKLMQLKQILLHTERFLELKCFGEDQIVSLAKFEWFENRALLQIYEQSGINQDITALQSKICEHFNYSISDKRHSDRQKVLSRINHLVSRSVDQVCNVPEINQLIEESGYKNEMLKSRYGKFTASLQELKLR